MTGLYLSNSHHPSNYDISSILLSLTHKIEPRYIYIKLNLKVTTRYFVLVSSWISSSFKLRLSSWPLDRSTIARCSHFKPTDNCFKNSTCSYIIIPSDKTWQDLQEIVFSHLVAFNFFLQEISLKFTIFETPCRCRNPGREQWIIRAWITR